MWRMCRNALPVKGVILKRKINIDPIYPLCFDDIESIDHLFTECQTSKKVWELLGKHHWILANVLSSISQSWL